MFEFFACMFLVNAIIALLQWYLLNNSFEAQLKSATDRLNTFWEEKLATFDISFS